MRFNPVEITDKKGRLWVLRNAEPDDAIALIEVLKQTAKETPFLLREPEEVTFTPEQEAQFIQSCLDDPKGLLLVAVHEGGLAGSCSLFPAGPFQRVSHRCEAAIALLEAFQGAGLGEHMMRNLLQAGASLGYEQAELEVIADNAPAIALYEKLGFVKHGTFPNRMKYKDGSYAHALWMMKTL